MKGFKDKSKLQRTIWTSGISQSSIQTLLLLQNLNSAQSSVSFYAMCVFYRFTVNLWMLHALYWPCKSSAAFLPSLEKQMQHPLWENHPVNHWNPLQWLWSDPHFYFSAQMSFIHQRHWESFSHRHSILYFLSYPYSENPASFTVIGCSQGQRRDTGNTPEMHKHT